MVTPALVALSEQHDLKSDTFLPYGQQGTAGMIWISIMKRHCEVGNKQDISDFLPLCLQALFQIVRSSISCLPQESFWKEADVN